jgi:hypothetical protein
LIGGGDLTADRTLSIPKATGAVDGYISATDFTIFNGKQNALGFTPVPDSRTLTINGVTQDLTANRTFTVSTGITIGTTAITSGTVGRVLFQGTGNVVSQSGNLFWDDTNGRFGIGGTPTTSFQVFGTSTIQTALPQTTATYDLGSSPLRFRNIWAGSFIASQITVNQIVYGTTNFTFFNSASATVGTFFGSGNLLLSTGTQTDAGFKLDVNGTARVQGDLTIGTGNGFLRGNNNFVNIFSPTDQVNVFVSARGAVSGTLGYFGNTELKASGGVSGSSIGISQTNAFVAISQGSVNNINTETFVVNRGFFGNVVATDKNLLRVSSTFNSNVTNGTLLRGIYVDINDTTTFTGFTDFRAIEAPRGGAYFNTTSVNASAILQADSTTKGFLPPRLTTTQKNAIASPTAGLVVYDSTLNKLCVRTASAWETITSL